MRRYDAHRVSLPVMRNDGTCTKFDPNVALDAASRKDFIEVDERRSFRTCLVNLNRLCLNRLRFNSRETVIQHVVIPHPHLARSTFSRELVRSAVQKILATGR